MDLTTFGMLILATLQLTAVPLSIIFSLIAYKAIRNYSHKLIERIIDNKRTALK